MGGPGSGPRPLVSLEIRAFVERKLDEWMPELLEKAREIAYGPPPDKVMIAYLLDRRLGRAHISIDQRLSGEVKISASLVQGYVLALQAALEEENALLGEYRELDPGDALAAEKEAEDFKGKDGLPGVWVEGNTTEAQGEAPA